MSKADEIVKSPSGRLMKGYVVPIYDEDEYMLYVFEAIGKEIDSLWKAVNELSVQYFPQFATWTLRYWEDLLGLQIQEGMTAEERRSQVILTLQTYFPVNPQRVEIVATSASGVKVGVENNVEAYTFRLILNETIEDANIPRMVREVERIKPAHLSFVIMPRYEEMIEFVDKVFISERLYHKVQEFRVGLPAMKEQSEVEIT